jgi:hypothetical protein
MLLFWIKGMKKGHQLNIFVNKIQITVYKVAQSETQERTVQRNQTHLSPNQDL